MNKIIVVILALHFPIKLRFPANTPISTTSHSLSLTDAPTIDIKEATFMADDSRSLKLCISGWIVQSRHEDLPEEEEFRKYLTSCLKFSFR